RRGEIRKGLWRGAELRVVMHPVVGAFELQDLLPAGKGARQADRVKRRVGSGGGEADSLRASHVRYNPTRQLDRRVVQIGESVRAAFGLIRHRRLNGWMSVAEKKRARAQHIVNV